MKYLSLLAFALSSIEVVYCWGNLGHETIGYVAMQFLAPNALAFVQASLGSQYSESLGPAATWADSVRRTHGYTWSEPLHFVDAEDSPPNSCSVSVSRDCSKKGGCVISAIANYTTRVVDTSLSDSQRQEALKFLASLKFLGDIGQPLHAEAMQRGGNSIHVTCARRHSNLHAVWDTGMIEELLKQNYDDSVTTWANALGNRISSGDYAADAPGWIACTPSIGTQANKFVAQNVNEYLWSPETNALDCPLGWAQEANAYDCSYVFSYTPGDDLCSGDYYTNAIPILELQIAKQGYRLAAWLNALFDGSSSL